MEQNQFCGLKDTKGNLEKGIQYLEVGSEGARDAALSITAGKGCPLYLGLPSTRRRSKVWRQCVRRLSYGQCQPSPGPVSQVADARKESLRTLGRAAVHQRGQHAARWTNGLVLQKARSRVGPAPRPLPCPDVPDASGDPSCGSSVQGSQTRRPGGTCRSNRGR